MAALQQLIEEIIRPEIMQCLTSRCKDLLDRFAEAHEQHVDIRRDRDKVLQIFEDIKQCAQACLKQSDVVVNGMDLAIRKLREAPALPQTVKATRAAPRNGRRAAKGSVSPRAAPKRVRRAR